MEHMKTPWPGIDAMPSHQVILSASEYERARVCVNVCSGIPTPELGLYPSGGLLRLSAKFNKIDEQRNELLAALENLLKVHECEGGTKYRAGNIARDAIAHAKQS